MHYQQNQRVAISYWEGNMHLESEAYLSILRPPREDSGLWCLGRMEPQDSSLWLLKAKLINNFPNIGVKEQKQLKHWGAFVKTDLF